ncbi:MAG: histidine phosphatase family protein [Rhodospirillaceae bacterium]
MTPIALIRHGPTDWNAEHRLQGRADRPLSEDGRAQVAAWRLPPAYRAFDWVVSPLSRARQTAELLELEILRLEPAVVEMDWGDWEGRTRPELDGIYGDEVAKRAALGLDLRPHNGESPRDVRDRVAVWAQGIASSGRPTGAVCHQGIIRAALSLATGWSMVGKPPEKMDWSSLHLFHAFGDGRLEIAELNVSLLADAAGTGRP